MNKQTSISEIITKSAYDVAVMKDIGSSIAKILDERIPSCINSFNNTMQLAEQIEKWFSEDGVTSIRNFSIDGNHINVPVHISVNNVVVHGLPSYDIAIPKNALMRVDLVGFKNGMYADAARTYILGEVSEIESQMVAAAYKTLASVKDGIKAHDKFSKISRLIENEISKSGFVTSNSLTGHGIGAVLHDYPSVYNFYNREYFVNNDFLLKPNMTFAIEPLLFEIGAELKYNSQNHEFYVKSEHSISAHVENTYLLTEEDGFIPITSMM